MVWHIVRITVIGAMSCIIGCVAMPSKKLDWRMEPAFESKKAATLRCWPSIQIVSMDNVQKDLGVGDGLWFQKCDIQIDPGPHKLVVKHWSKSGGPISITTSTDERTVRFTAEPNGIYQLAGSPVKANGAWIPNAYHFEVRRESR